MSESGSRENRHRISNTRRPCDRPSEYQSTSAPSVAVIAAITAIARSMRPAPDSAPAPSSMGTAGAGTPACTTNAHAKTTTTPYPARRSGAGATGSRRESGLDQPGPLLIHVGLQHRPTKTANRMQDHLHVSSGVQHEYGGRSWLHQPLHLRDELTSDAGRRHGHDRAGASDHRPDRRADHWHAEHEARDEAHGGTAQDVGGGRKPVSVEREGSVRVPHDHRHLVEDEGVRDPPQADDFVADLVGALHVVVPDCPQVFGLRHCRIPYLVSTSLHRSPGHDRARGSWDRTPTALGQPTHGDGELAVQPKWSLTRRLLSGRVSVRRGDRPLEGGE